jgi:ribonuclease P protein component
VRGFGLPRRARLLHAHEFRRVYGRGRRASGQFLVVVAAPRREPGHRLGVAVSKEHGTAVRRNKIKRILREAFRLERPDLPGAFDLVLIPRVREGRLELREVRRELHELLAKIATRPAEPQRRRRRGRRKS